MKNKATSVSFFLCLFLLAWSATAIAQIDQKQLKKHIYFLASDKMKGRGTGSKEVRKAADYVEKHFKKYGLKPQGEVGYRQSFQAKVRRVVVPDSIRQADNIIGLLDNGARKTIVIGAHYDHLGMGHQGSSRDSLGVGKIHNGADDNASGVAGLLELARHYTTNKEIEPFNILFIAFGAEELGLVGSKYFTENPTIPLSDIHWMLNMDMIGRYNPNGVAVIGYGTSSKFPLIFEGITSTIKFNLSKDGNGGSDQTSFYKKNIPVLFFHTGGHDDYHKPGDDPEKINYPDLAAILQLEIDVVNNSMKYPSMDFIWTN
ncbi:M20/M25/M40 family metallo-hydrolase [Sphingobacterium psychroaquaticum]|uniref:Peptidase family M28 n=1 Tax=Sphingobacterium psychroaquaticum TaxID=561061 RepID=A0A1X7L9B1_9SPHI|nr:M20/M25/M40 family metallo-hydrolase [Sphingobacterium psychroaquaticum]QBQ42372.1 M20/M25/M40 family metallo-hydrolase [Sphingobacterium psychroaquaticum]SMG49759.1 Peptidase family M28 [Sphingobacterium psychroaquaticum]